MLIRSILLILFSAIYQINCLPPFPQSTMGTNAGDKTNKSGNSLSKFVFQIGFNILIAFVCCINMCYMGPEPVSFFDYTLFSLVLLGTAIRFRAYYELGYLFTFDIGIREDHKLITTGIYKYIRHPGYLGSFLVTIPLWIFANVNIYFTSIITLFTLYIFWQRIRHEEVMLLNHFSMEYKNYAGRTKRLIPYVF